MSTARRAVIAILQPGKVKAIFADRKDAHAQLYVVVSNCERVSQHATRDCHASQLRQLLAELMSPVLRIDTHVAALFEKSGEAEPVDIMRWVSPITYKANHHAACYTRVEGTAEWILTNQTYQERRSSSAFYVLVASWNLYVDLH